MRWLIAALLIASPALAAAPAVPLALKAQLAASAAAMADPDSTEPSRQVDLARAHLALCVKAWGPASPQTALCEMELGRALIVEMVTAEARSVLESAIRHLGPKPDPLQLAKAQSLLGEALEREGDFAASDRMLTAALAVQTRPAERALTLRRQAILFASQSRLADAARALADAEAATAAAGSAISVHDAAQVHVAAALVAGEERDGSDRATAELGTAIAQMEKRFGAADSRLGRPLEIMRGHMNDQGGGKASLPWSERALAVERARPRQNLAREGSAMADLGSDLANLGRPAEGIALMRSAVEIAERTQSWRSLGPRAYGLAQALDSVGQGQAAIPIYDRAIFAAERTYGPDHPYVGLALKAAAQTHGRNGDLVTGIAMARRALAIHQRANGPDHPYTIFAANYLGNILAERSPADAVPIMEQAVAAAERRFGPDARDTLIGRVVLARVLAAAGSAAASEAQIDRIMASVHRPRLGEVVLAGAAPAERDSLGAGQFNILYYNLFQLAKQRPGQEARLLSLLQAEEALLGSARIAWRSAARLAARNPDIARLADLQRAEEAKLQLLRRQALTSKGTVETVAAIAASDARLQALERQIAGLDPGFAALAGAAEAPLSAFAGGDQPLLHAGEALLAFRQSFGDLVLLLITRDGPQMIRLPNTAAADLAALVARVRSGLAIDAALTAADLPAFDLAAAHELYQRVIAPLLPHLNGISTLHIVPDGPIARLPLALLVEQPGTGGDATTRYRNTRWLGDRFRLISQPGIAAFAAARSIGAPSRADRPVFAVADPALGGTTQVAGLSGFATLRGSATGGARNAAAICAMQPLPDTRREALRLTQALKGDTAALLLGEAATERGVRTLSDKGDLAQYRTVLFATHGLAGVESSGEEPALILKPASCSATADEDDGLLSASEIATLKLDADLVILSGCNTAAPGDALAGEPFSGLAQAFRHAGARRLLVSHWSVDSAATADFMGSLFAGGRAVTPDRLQAAMKAMRNSKGALAYRAHPAFWAPFVLVGDTQ